MMPSPEQALRYLHTEPVSSTLGVEGWKINDRTKAWLYRYEFPFVQLIHQHGFIRANTSALRTLVEDANELLRNYFQSTPRERAERIQMRMELERHISRLEEPTDMLLRGRQLATLARNEAISRLKTSNPENHIVVADLQRIIESCARQYVSTQNHTYKANTALLNYRRWED